MRKGPLTNVNVVSQETLVTPARLARSLPLGPAARAAVLAGRRSVQAVLDRTDPRLLVIVGPCSIHDLDAAREYAHRLEALAGEVGDTLMLLMRVYFEKPRTTIGWKGFLNDPYLDDSFRIGDGLRLARQLLIELARMGVPAAAEALDPITPQYLGDLITWYAIGARTTESQTHREMASGLSAPVGFKNGTDGGLDIAVAALKAASHPHAFLGIDGQGRSAVVRTRGNAYGHVILRGGREPNHDAASVARCEAALRKAGLPCNLVIDCSHGNSGKEPARQTDVFLDGVRQLEAGNRSIVGLMLESNLEAGAQPFCSDRAALRPGQSVTDACLDWETTARLLREAHARLAAILARPRAG
jgi:3-deoxy-7-phosphoheptulonate synthase